VPYLLDGDNVIGSARGRRGTAHDRDALVREVSDRLRRTRARVVLFFDGVGAGVSLGNLSVRFAGAVSGDEAIVREVGHTSPSREAIVVTADRELARRVRDAGGTAITPQAFWERFGKAASTTRREEKTVDVEEWMNWFSEQEAKRKE
jgi:predicted RNA-binding protein with PIN domain